MILVDSIYINNGGGSVLLELLVNKLEEVHKGEIYYLFDHRMNVDKLKISQKHFVKLYYGELSRYNFYYFKMNEFKFTKILCFANVPPPIKTNIPVFIYFHQPLFLINNIWYTSFQSFKRFIKTNYIKYLNNSSYTWLVQTEHIRKLIKKIFLHENVLIFPFFHDSILNKKLSAKGKIIYFYPAFPSIHKNHLRLFNAFSKFCLINSNVELHVTINNSNSNVLEYCNYMISKGVPIINHGTLNHESILKLYYKMDFLIFPSTNESFGLPLIEAVLNGCKVIASDLSYTHEVISPSLLFNPYSEFSILDSLLQSMNNSNPSKILISNKLNELLEILNPNK